MLPHDLLKSAASRIDPKAAGQLSGLLSAIECNGDAIRIRDVDLLEASVGALALIAAFGDPAAKTESHRLAWAIADARGIYPASIEALYRKVGKGELPQFTVPAMNMRAIAFESARGVFHAMRDEDVGAAIFELSRGEIGFTGQRPKEYATIILCAAIAEGHIGPVFLQGDHFQISPSRFAQDPEAELRAVEDLIAEAISAGFFNIDIDCSTLVNLSFPTEAQQQRLNIDLTAKLVRHARALEPEGVTISLGGEIGEVGDENSTAAEVLAYLDGVNGALGPDMSGLSKLSIQSGTRHGGNVLPDGSFGDMNVDFGLIVELTAACRARGGLAGCVQHGASMLTLEKIARLSKADCSEVHLAAAFLNAVYDHLPRDIVGEADSWLKENFANEWKSDWSEAQFLHHARRYPIGPFKRVWWDATEVHDDIRAAVRNKAAAYFDALGVRGTRNLVSEVTTHGPVVWPGGIALQAQDGDEALIRDLAD